MGQGEHARIQWLLAHWFGSHQSTWEAIGSTEQRVQVSPTRVRVPDLVVLRPGPQPDILTQPPLLVIETLFPEDSDSDMQERCQDYRQMGVEIVWIIDPKTRSGRMFSEAKWVSADRLAIAGSPIHVDPGELVRSDRRDLQYRKPPRPYHHADTGFPAFRSVNCHVDYFFFALAFAGADLLAGVPSSRSPTMCSRMKLVAPDLVRVPATMPTIWLR